MIKTENLFFKYEDEKDNQEETFNNTILAVARFYGYMVLKKQVTKVPIHFKYYLKKVTPHHNDRAVDINHPTIAMHNCHRVVLDDPCQAVGVVDEPIP